MASCPGHDDSNTPATSDETLESRSSLKSDSALGSELVEDDVSVPLSVASLSDDEDDDALNSPCKSVTPSSKSSINVSPSKSTDDCVSLSSPTSSSDCDFPAPGQPLSSDDNNVTIPQSDQLIPSSPSASHCETCDSHVSAVSDSRDGDADTQLEDPTLTGHLRSRRPVGQISFPPQHLQHHHQQQQQWLSHERLAQSSTMRSGVEDVETISSTTFALETDHLVDSCDEEDVGEAAAAAAGAGVDEPMGGCGASEKKHSIVEENDSVRNSSFSKLDPTTWPSWLGRFLADSGVSAESSFDDEVLVKQNGSW